MALITDPDFLNLGTEVVINEAGRTIELVKAGNLSDDGVTLQAVYSFMKEEWRINDELIKFPFPMDAITAESMELVDDWVFLNDNTRNLVRIGGWKELLTGDEYAGIITLGVLGENDQVYYQQDPASSNTSNIVLTGAVNQAVRIFSPETADNFNHRGFLKLYVREFEKTYSDADLSDIGVTTMTYQVYRFPLANATDLKIVDDDNTVDTTAPYTGMSIEWFGTPQTRTIGPDTFDFSVIINGNDGSLEQIYTFVQRQLRKNEDIDAGAGTQVGKVANALLLFVGDTLRTLLYDTSQGTFIDDHLVADRARMELTDDTGEIRTFPTITILTVNFGANLVNDANAKFWVFFTNDDAATTPQGNNYGTSNAIIVNTTERFDTATRARSGDVATIETSTEHGLSVGDGVRIEGVGGTGYNGVFFVASVPTATSFTYSNSGGDETQTADTGGTVTQLMAGNVGGASSKQFGYDYDFNDQRGAGSEGDNAPITAVAIGLNTAQFVSATSTITDAASVVSLIAALERNYVSGS